MTQKNIWAFFKSKNKKKPNKDKTTFTCISIYNNKYNKTTETHEKEFMKQYGVFL